MSCGDVRDASDSEQDGSVVDDSRRRVSPVPELTIVPMAAMGKVGAK
jgi:hypothetical protein